MYTRLAILFRVLIVVTCCSFGQIARADVVLMMAEEPGCVWCARWNAEIGPAYPKTGEGRAAPLRRVDISQPLPEDITLARRVNFTPTFILLDEGQELGRLEGYAGDLFFWGLLDALFDAHDIAYDNPDE
jgi:hypothetical protein